MPIVMRAVYEPDDLDRRMNAQGLIADVEAAEALGITCRALDGIMRAHNVSPEKLFGRVYWAQSDIELLQRGGSPSEERRAYEIAMRRLNGLPDFKPPETPAEAAARAAQHAPSGASMLSRVFGRKGGQ